MSWRAGVYTPVQTPVEENLGDFWLGCVAREIGYAGETEALSRIKVYGEPGGAAVVGGVFGVNGVPVERAGVLSVQRLTGFGATGEVRVGSAGGDMRVTGGHCNSYEGCHGGYGEEKEWHGYWVVHLCRQGEKSIQMNKKENEN